MGRAAQSVPIVVLPEQISANPPALSSESRIALDRAVWRISVLREVLHCATAATRKLPEALKLATDGLRTLAVSILLGATGIDEIEIETLPVHECFGVRRAHQTPEQHLSQVANILSRTVGDLNYALINMHDTTAEIEATAAILNRFQSGYVALGSCGQTENVRSAQVPYEPTGDGLERWVLVHHAYFLFNLYAALTARLCVEAIQRDDEEQAAALLRETSVYVRGFTAAMVHSAAVPSEYYCDIIRPTMQPPAMALHLTGTMQVEHASYRSALDQFFEICGESFLWLVRTKPKLALARDELLEADLLDIERHIWVASVLVGNDKSLTQHEQSPENAVSALRRIRHARARRYCPLMRFGDRMIQHEMETSAAR